VLHDVALQGLPLILCVDRAGFNAADGATHHGVFDVSFLSAMDGVRIFAPVTLSGLAASLRAAKKVGGVTAIRYPSGCENGVLRDAFYGGAEEESTPTVRVFDSGENPTVTVLTHGRIAAEALKVASTLLENGVSVRILLCEYLAPYGELAAEVAPLLAGDSVVFYEEEIRHGGFGMCLSDALITHGALKGKKTAIVAAEKAFVTPASGETMWQAAGVDAAALLRAVQKLQEQGE
jgi:1-deoxy-D-xylulose-5-phosphate synthase